MALPSSGAMSHSMIQGEFGGSNPIHLSEYYGVAAGVPTSGTIRNSDFYGTSASTAGPTVRIWPSKSSAEVEDRYGFGLSNKTSFVHPEAGWSGSSFGSINQYSGVAGGLNFVGLQVCDYSWEGKYYIQDSSDGIWKPTGSGEMRQITFTIEGLTSVETWTKVHFIINGSEVVLNRSDKAWYGSNEYGIPYITFGSWVTNFNTIYTHIYNASRQSYGTTPIDLYFS